MFGRLGPEAVTLVFRDPVLDGGGFPVLDVYGIPTFDDRLVDKADCSFIAEQSEQEPGALFAVYTAKICLPFDTDTLALTSKDAVRGPDGKLYELQGDAEPKNFPNGVASHVRVHALSYVFAGAGERVTITPHFTRDDDGVEAPPAGDPLIVIARGVTAGNTAERFGASGAEDEADFTVALDLGTPIEDGDLIRVRGRNCRARVQLQQSQHPARRMLIVLCKSITGGAT